MIVGLNCPLPQLRQAAEAVLASAGWPTVRLGHATTYQDAVVVIDGNDQARTVRDLGGLVVHMDTGRAPYYPGHRGPGGLTVQVGDLVYTGARADAWTLARLVTDIVREAE